MNRSRDWFAQAEKDLQHARVAQREGSQGVGSDLDLVAIVDRADDPFERRSLAWPVETLPVQAEVLVYTPEEWERMLARRAR